MFQYLLLLFNKILSWRILSWNKHLNLLVKVMLPVSDPQKWKVLRAKSLNYQDRSIYSNDRLHWLINPHFSPKDRPLPSLAVNFDANDHKFGWRPTILGQLFIFRTIEFNLFGPSILDLTLNPNQNSPIRV